MKGGPWFMVYIDAVHYEKNIYGFELISHLKWTNTLSQPATNICTKSELINFINNNPNSTKTKYYNSWKGWVVGEDVRVVDNSYLRTDSNNIKADNLGSLPRF